MQDFEKLLKEIREATGWSDYKICDELNRHGHCCTQPQIYRVRMGQKSEEYWKRYTLGSRIKALHKRRLKVPEKKTKRNS